MKINDDDQNNVFSLFGGLDKLLNVVADMVEKEKDEVYIQGDLKSTNKNKSIGKYGFNVILGPDKLSQFNNAMEGGKTVKKDNSPKAITPITDIFKEEDKIIIVMELPGVEKDNIELSLDRNKISITAIKKDIYYSKELDLDFTPEYSLIKESFQNSIYTIMLIKNM